MRMPGELLWAVCALVGVRGNDDDDDDNLKGWPRIRMRHSRRRPMLQ